MSVKRKIFPSIGLHLIKPCNMKCKFCHSKYEDIHAKQIPKQDVCVILDKLKSAGLRKVNFAGGEPLLYKDIVEVVQHAKEIGLLTQIFTNGFFLDDQLLMALKPHLDWISLSVDSLSKETNIHIGRVHKGNEMVDYYGVAKKIKQYDFRFKVNTVVSKFNENENIQEFLSSVQPDIWKIIQVFKVDDQNLDSFNECKVDIETYHKYINRHTYPHNKIIVETNELTHASHLMVDPTGRLYDSVTGPCTYSTHPLTTDSVENCLYSINEVSWETYRKRNSHQANCLS